MSGLFHSGGADTQRNFAATSDDAPASDVMWPTQDKQKAKEKNMKIPKKLLLTLISAIVFAGFAVSEGYAQPGRASFGGNNGRHLGWSRGRHRGWNRGRKVGFGNRRFNRGRSFRDDRRRFDDRRFIFRNSRNRSIRNRRIFFQNDRRRFSNRQTRNRRVFISRLY